MVFVDVDVHGVSVAEEVVQVAQDFLIGSHEKDAQIVVLAVLEFVHWQGVCHALRRDEVGDFAVAVAGDVLYRRAAVGLFVEPLQRHHREHLVDGPGVGQRLEEREVAEVFLGQHPCHRGEFVGGMLHVAHDVVHVARHAPEEFLHQCACAQVDESQTKAVERLVANLQRVVPVLEQAGLVDFVPDFIQVFHQVVVVVVHLVHVVVPLWQSCAFHHLDD